MLQEQKAWGLVAILDALGAANYSQREIGRFMRSRQIVLKLLNAKAEALAPRMNQSLLKTFTFNDTVVIAYETEKKVPLDDVKSFFTLLRKFAIDSLKNGILFRGAIAIGSFYADDETNTILGPAVTDAAAWYDRADWIGIHATPHASLVIESLKDFDRTKLEHLIIDYPVPLTDGTSVPVKAVNWPKAFFVSGLTPDVDRPREKFLALLTEHRVPKGTEKKYFNAVTFFDFAPKAPRKRPKKSARRNSA